LSATHVCAAPDTWQLNWDNAVRNTKKSLPLIIFDEGLTDPFFDRENGHETPQCPAIS
jgi:hypothetical protein